MEVIHAPDSTKASNPDCIPVKFLKSRLYIYIINFTKSRFSEVTHVSLNAAQRLETKSYRPIKLLSVLGKIFEELKNGKLVEHPGKSSLFRISNNCFPTFHSTVELCAVVTDSTELLNVMCQSLFTGSDMLVFFTNLSLMEFMVGLAR